MSSPNTSDNLPSYLLLCQLLHRHKLQTQDLHRSPAIPTSCMLPLSQAPDPSLGNSRRGPPLTTLRDSRQLTHTSAGHICSWSLLSKGKSFVLVPIGLTSYGVSHNHRPAQIIEAACFHTHSQSQLQTQATIQRGKMDLFPKYGIII